MKKIFLLSFMIISVLLPFKAMALIDNENLDLYEVIPYNEQLSLEEKNKSLGIISTHDIINDKALWALSASTTTDLNNLANLMSFQVNFLKNLDYFWVNGFVSLTNATFETISHTNQYLEPTNPIKSDTTEKLITGGLGLGYRFFWIQTLLEDVLNTKDIYEFTSASFTYQTLSEAHLGDSFTGFGLQTDFTIVKRLSPSYHIGLKTAYNISSLKRKVPTGENSSANALVVSYLSMGLELGFYF